jgi:Family of unknown function (DUF5681)
MAGAPLQYLLLFGDCIPSAANGRRAAGGPSKSLIKAASNALSQNPCADGSWLSDESAVRHVPPLQLSRNQPRSSKPKCSNTEGCKMDDAKLSGKNPPQSPPLAKKRERPVGFGSPLVETRFKKGVSGNPGGRPSRRSRNRDIESIIRGAFTALVTIRDGRKRIRVSAIEAICCKFMEQALKDDHRAIVANLKLAKKIGLLAKPTHDLSKLSYEELEEVQRLTEKTLLVQNEER